MSSSSTRESHHDNHNDNDRNLELSHDMICETMDACLVRSNEILSQSKHSGLRLRRATKEDANSILDLVRALALYEKDPDAVRTTAATFACDGFGGSHPLFYCVLLEDNDDDHNNDNDNIVCGLGFWYLGYSSRTGVFLYLEDLFVQPEYRGLGGGKTIMYTLADIAQNLQCTRLVWQALDWNTPALNFYAGIGACRRHF